MKNGSAFQYRSIEAHGPCTKFENGFIVCIFFLQVLILMHNINCCFIDADG